MDDENTALRGGTAYELGRMHGRITALESRVDKQETLLGAIDGKLDNVLIALAQAVGGRAKLDSLIKVSLAVVTAIAMVGSAIAAILLLRH